MIHILLTNDDGYLAKGINTLYHALKKLNYKVTMVAPRSERSAQSHAMTFHQALTVEKISEDIFAVSGTPADCVAIGIAHILKQNPPDFVVSGINHGFNVGVDVNYSGTVGAATEGSLMGYKSIAVSMDSRVKSEKEREENFERTAQLVGNVLKNSSQLDWPKLQVLNINAPLNFKSVSVARCESESLYIPFIEELPSKHQEEIKIYLIGGLSRNKPKDNSQDVSLVEHGFATISYIAARQSSLDMQPNLEKFVGSLQNDKI